MGNAPHGRAGQHLLQKGSASCCLPPSMPMSKQHWKEMLELCMSIEMAK